MLSGESYYPKLRSIDELDALMHDEAQRIDTERFFARLAALRAADDAALFDPSDYERPVPPPVVRNPWVSFSASG